MLARRLLQLQKQQQQCCSSLNINRVASSSSSSSLLFNQRYHNQINTQSSFNNNNNIRYYSSKQKQQQQKDDIKNKDKYQQVMHPDELMRQKQEEAAKENEVDDPESLVPLDPVQFITESDLGVKFVIDVPKPLEAVSERIHKAIQDKDYRYLNPYTYLFPTRTFALDAAYFPLKVRSMFKSMVPFKREKLEKNGTQMAIESFRDVFHTLRAEKIDYKFSIRDIRVVIDHIEPALPFFQANALYFIDGEFRLPSILGDKPMHISYYTPIVWLSKFPEMTENDQRELEDINFDTEIEWKPARIEMVGVVREIADKKVAEIMARLKDSYKRIVEEAEERQEQRLESEKNKSSQQQQPNQSQPKTNNNNNNSNNKK
ncbi:hypothetical protein PPL_00248 [Heterostelium album PN500]|uniref:Uncharacterized protein n=1 Tax=Heterostelium pallidum (strain ATCC 26659 / Pp 5 / PN500) TaxID=670386 RepID=D3AVY2_HETP5|nr:hypothetical protein PPL_00248 [Heterostelium album PN500]EFA86455.1 hypothetical protein PPL_00248 [Heterostelium album PN500]|eukprot:XP_020438560.1 hypothetical protein PPL_00248 [Heterostelium album PN500]